MDRHHFYLIAGLWLIYHQICFADKPYPIEYPGADLANFPNSAFTLPAGKAYLELIPVNYTSHAAVIGSAQYTFSALIRYGFSDNLELRFFANAFSHSFDEAHTTGFSSQTLEMKWHIRDEENGSALPAIAIEAGSTIDLLRHNGHDNLLPSLSMNFDQELPFGIALEYNIGFITLTDEFNQLQAQLALSWAFQRKIHDNTSVFLHGYTNTAAGETTSAIGGGIQWIPDDGFTAFTNVSAGLTKATPDISVLSGFAVAF